MTGSGWSYVVVSNYLHWWLQKTGGTPYNCLYEGAPSERGTFFRLQVYERVGIWLVEVYERVGKSVLKVCKKAQKD